MLFGIDETSKLTIARTKSSAKESFFPARLRIIIEETDGSMLGVLFSERPSSMFY